MRPGAKARVRRDEPRGPKRRRTGDPYNRLFQRVLPVRAAGATSTTVFDKGNSVAIGRQESERDEPGEAPLQVAEDAFDAWRRTLRKRRSL